MELERNVLPLEEWLVSPGNITISLEEIPIQEDEPELMDEDDHDHVMVFDPLLEKTLNMCDDIPGTWVYMVDGEIKTMNTTIGQVPVYGLFKVFNLDHIVQKIPRH